MPRSRYRILEVHHPHFMTATINNWLPLFTRPQTVAKSQRPCLIPGVSYNDKENPALFGYVILENHLHLVAAAPDLSAAMQRFKSWTARRIINYLEETRARRMLELLALFKRAHKTQTTYQIWEEGSHPQAVMSEAAMRQKIDYIHHNPVARNYLGQPGLIEVCREW
uniref:Transposase IS200-like domain-containing protein n=1 Tax=Candidatus Kentrum sp. DK TaxID=2126562 RepID=A0A450SGN0_9GAMM|nr:MAG: hypothetical protein BECKDK2373B_GA0170837_103612 [Candidatus Kentron sp. DK]